MSTRAQIAFYPSEDAPIATQGTVYLYQHQDGSPEYVLPILEPFVRSFRQYRPLADTAYATARCLVALATAQDRERTRALQAGIPSRALEQVEYLGLGADTTLYATIAFFYHVSPTRIGVYRVSLRGGPAPAFLLADTISLTPPSPEQGAALSGEAR